MGLKREAVPIAQYALNCIHAANQQLTVQTVALENILGRSTSKFWPHVLRVSEIYTINHGWAYSAISTDALFPLYSFKALFTVTEKKNMLHEQCIHVWGAREAQSEEELAVACTRYHIFGSLRHFQLRLTNTCLSPASVILMLFPLP